MCAGRIRDDVVGQLAPVVGADDPDGVVGEAGVQDRLVARPRSLLGHAVAELHLPDDTQPLAAEVFGRFLPNLVAAGMIDGHHEMTSGVPLLEGRTAIDGKPTAYVCRNRACELPVTERTALAKQLDVLPTR